MSGIKRSGSRSSDSPIPSPSFNTDGIRDSRSHSQDRKSRERKEPRRPCDDHVKSRSRSWSRGRKPHRGKYSSTGRRGSSRSRSRSPMKIRRFQRSRSRSYSRSRSDGDRKIYRSRSHSPLSLRRRHVGSRDNPRPSRCLGVFGLSIFTTEQQIYNIFSKYGAVERVQVVIDAKTGRSRGFCFVYFKSTDDATVAKEECSGREIDGRYIRVDYSITHRAHTPTPGIYMGKPTIQSRGWNSRRSETTYRRSPSPYYNRRRSRYERSRSPSFSPRRY